MYPHSLSAAALKYGGEHIEAGMTTWELDKLIYDFIVKHGRHPQLQGAVRFPRNGLYQFERYHHPWYPFA